MIDIPKENEREGGRERDRERGSCQATCEFHGRFRDRSCGVMLYEMLFGAAPYRCSAREEAAVREFDITEGSCRGCFKFRGVYGRVALFGAVQVYRGSAPPSVSLLAWIASEVPPLAALISESPTAYPTHSVRCVTSTC